MSSLGRPVLGTALVASLCSVVFPVWGAAWLLVLLLVGSLLWRASGRGGPGGYLAAVDDLIFSGEQLIVTVSLLVMAFVVFLDVVWRTASGMDAGAARWAAGALFVLVMLGAWTARAPGVGFIARTGVGLGVFAAVGASGWAVAQTDNGFGWSQRLALVLVVWVGLLGGSMATRQNRHITVDAVRRVVPPRFARGFEILSGTVTVVTCVFLAVIGGLYCRGNIDDWLEAERLAFKFESIPIPYWGATLAMPVGFGLMAARFLGRLIVGSDPASDGHQVDLQGGPSALGPQGEG